MLKTGLVRNVLENISVRVREGPVVSRQKFRLQMEVTLISKFIGGLRLISYRRLENGLL